MPPQTGETTEAVIEDALIPPAHFYIHTLKSGKIIKTEHYDRNGNGTYKKTGADKPLEKSQALHELLAALNEDATLPAAFRSKEVYAFILTLYVENDAQLRKETKPADIDDRLLPSEKAFFRALTNSFASNAAKQGKKILTDEERTRLADMFGKLVEPGSFVSVAHLEEIKTITRLPEQDIRKIAGFPAR